MSAPVAFVKTKPPRVLFTKSMPKGGVDTGKVYVLTDEQASRYDSDPSVVAAMMKQMAELKTGDMQGNIEIRHPKGYTIGLWNGLMSTFDPNQSMPDINGMTKQTP